MRAGPLELNKPWHCDGRAKYFEIAALRAKNLGPGYWVPDKGVLGSSLRFEDLRYAPRVFAALRGAGPREISVQRTAYSVQDDRRQRAEGMLDNRRQTTEDRGRINSTLGGKEGVTPQHSSFG